MTSVGDIFSAYIEANTKEKVGLTDDPEIKELEGYTFIIKKSFEPVLKALKFYALTMQKIKCFFLSSKCFFLSL
jgi:hypothetical protein